MSSPSERNDRKSAFRKGGKTGSNKAERPGPPGVPGRSGRPRETPGGRAASSGANDWLWGVHAVEAALANPSRPRPKLILATADRAARLEARFGRLPALQVAEGAEIGRKLPPGAVHQGLALRIDPAEPLSIFEIGMEPTGLLVMLDQVTDPQNVGAIFRSAAAFGARGVILQDRHAPALSGALAKAAAGAVDMIPSASAVNLSRAIDELKDLGWRVVGLAGEAETELEAALDGSPTVIVMGSEGEGLRRLVAERCDTLAKIPMPGGFESLNVSNAAAIAFYEAARRR